MKTPTRHLSCEFNHQNYSIHNISFQLANLASRAILYEVSCFPSPGLVSPISNGAHKDMDYYTFLDSTTALMKYFALFAQAGLSENTPSDIFKSIRKIGIKAEQEMFTVTHGINTHKGMLFLMGISCAATAKALHDQSPFSRIPNLIKEMTAGIVNQDLQNLTKENAISHGEKLFVNYGITGVRGEVESGMPTVFKHGLPFYQTNKDLPKNNRLIQTLFKIMSVCNDTTIVHRHSVTTLMEIKKTASEIIEIGGMRTHAGTQMITKLSDYFIKQNISPGGCADLLAITVFFDFVDEAW